MSGWGAGYLTPDEVAEQEAANDAERRAAIEYEQRRRMSPFERMLLDTLTELRDVIGARQPAGPVCPDCGAEQPILPSSAAVEHRGASAEPEDSEGSPGSARPQPGPEWIRDLLRDFCEWLGIDDSHSDNVDRFFTQYANQK